jgi:PAS domain S-box-containing protein
MHSHFGHDPARELRAIIDSIRGSTSTDSMVMAICQSKIDLGIYICDPAGRCKVANKPLCRLFGLSQEQMLNYGWSMAIAESEQRAVLDRWAEAVRGKSRYTATYHLQGVECYTEAEPVILDGIIHSYVGFVIHKSEAHKVR